MGTTRQWLHPLVAFATIVAPMNSAIAAPAQPMTTNKACDLTSFKTPANTTLTSARAIAAPVPYCRLDGYVTTTNPGPNKVRFMVAVPQKWNGRFLFTVQGGAAGFVPDPAPEHLSEGYAIGSTDKGVVTSNVLDFSFRSNPAMDLDWNWRGTHVAAVAGQALVRSYYGRQKVYRYVMGCSGGGIGTLTEAEMFPQDFDGYIVGSTSMDWPHSTTISWAVITQYVAKHPDSWISPQDYDRIYHALLAKYDAGDGAVDGLIWNPETIKLDGGDREALSFLSDAQFALLKVITADIKDANGKVLHPGFVLGNPKRWARFLSGATPPPWNGPQDYPAGFIVLDTASKARMGPSFSYLTSQDVLSFEHPPGVEGGSQSDHRRLSALIRTGAKMIVWGGLGEEAIPPGNTTGYTDRASATFGATKRPTFLRSFIFPGLHHCQGGENAPTDHVDMTLKAAERWVETGQAPDSIVVSNGPPGGIMGSYPKEMMPAVRGRTPDTVQPIAAPKATRTYLICSYPARSVFLGGADNPQKLDVNDARNWRCQS